MPPDFELKKLKMKRVDKVEDYYRFDYISLKQKTISLHTG